MRLKNNEKIRIKYEKSVLEVERGIINSLILIIFYIHNRYNDEEYKANKLIQQSEISKNKNRIKIN